MQSRRTGRLCADTLSGVTAKERVLAETPGWTEEQAEAALRAADANGQAAPEMAELPDRLKTFDDGTPVPNWVSLLGRSRCWHTPADLAAAQRYG